MKKLMLTLTVLLTFTALQSASAKSARPETGLFGPWDFSGTTIVIGGSPYDTSVKR